MPPRIFLVGYRGTGKSTVGRLVAARLGWAFADADEHLELAAGRSVSEIFAAEGEPAFRDRESAVLADLCLRDRTVIATGGGVVLRPANRDRLAGGFVVWLTAPPEAIWRRLEADPHTAGRRPNLTTAGGIQEVTAVLAAREPLYRSAADVAVPTDGRSPDAVAADILTAWEARTGRRPPPPPPPPG